MTEAIFGLVGVIIGGVLAGLGPYLLAARVERRRARAACRLLEDELRSAVRFLREGLVESSDFDDWHDGLKSLASSDLWKSHRATLAEVLSSSDWYAVSTAYQRVFSLRVFDVRKRLEAGMSVLQLVSILRIIVEDIEPGADAVARLAHRDTEQRRRRSAQAKSSSAA